MQKPFKIALFNTHSFLAKNINSYKFNVLITGDLFIGLVSNIHIGNIGFNVYFKEILNARNKRSALEFGISSNADLYKLTLIRTLDPNTLTNYTNMTIEELERSVILE